MRAIYERLLEHHVLGTLLYVLMVLAGLFALGRIPVEEYPNISFDQVAIGVVWPGASPVDVERLVAAKIEDEIEDVKGIAFIRSTSIQGLARIFVKMEDDIPDFERAFRDLESEVRKVRDLPPDAEPPEITKIDVEAVNPVIVVAIFGEAAEEVRRATAEELELRLEALPGVLRCEANGVRDREVHVEVDPERLAARGLTVGDVADALGARNVAAPGGTLRGEGAEMVVRTASDWIAATEIAGAPLAGSGGPGALRVGEVARVTAAFEDPVIRVRFQGRPASSLSVVKTREASALEVRERVVEALARFERDGLVHAGLELATVADTTVRIRERISILSGNIGLGAVLVAFILGLVIGPRMAFLALMGVGFAFLGTFAGLRFLGESLNVLSLFGLVLVCGMLVDDAIVVIENIARRHEEGAGMRAAALEGIVEVAAPVTASVLTTIAAFLPLLLMSGITGKFFAVIPKTVTLALAFSLFEALAILPIHAYKMGVPGARAGGEMRFAAFGRAYRRVLGALVRRRYLVLAIGLGVAAATFASAARLDVVFFPSDYQNLFVNAFLPPDASLDETEAALVRADEAVRDLGPDVIESSFATPGFYYDYNYQPHVNAHYGQLFVTLARADRRRLTTREAIAAARARLAREDLGRAEVEVAELNDGPPIGRPVVVRARAEELDRLRRLAGEVAEIVASVPGVRDVRMDLEVGKGTAVARLDEERAAATGLTAADVARAIADLNDGRIATRLNAGDDEWDVRVRAAPEFRRTVADLARARARSTSGAIVPIGQVARIEREAGFAAVTRYDRRRTATITGDVDPAVTTSLRANGEIARRVRPLLDREPGLAIEQAGEFEETQRSFRSLGEALLIALVAIFAILGAQFRSYGLPLVVLLNVPFAMIGVILGLHLTGDPFTVAIGVGVVGLAGVAVNDAIVLVDFANARRRAGASAAEAILEAGPKRLRAIFLTTITTVAGLGPTAVGLGGPRSIIWGPMATALCFGFAAQMFLTLLVTPAVYVIADDIGHFLSRSRTPPPATPPGPPA